jgi:hypothetical protein
MMYNKREASRFFIRRFKKPLCRFFFVPPQYFPLFVVNLNKNNQNEASPYCTRRSIFPIF